MLAAAPALAADLRLSLIGAPEGTVYAELYALPAENWDGEPVQRQAGRETLLFRDVPAGRYAVRLFVDLNENRQLDLSRRGIPKEPVGFSANPSLAEGLPTPEAAAFEHGEEDSLQLVRLRQERH